MLFVKGGTQRREVVREAIYGDSDPRFDCIVGRSFTRGNATFAVVERYAPWETHTRRALVPIVDSRAREEMLKSACLPVPPVAFR